LIHPFAVDRIGRMTAGRCAMMSFKQLLAGVAVAVTAVVLTLSVAPAQDKKGTAPIKGILTVELYKDKGGEHFRFRIKDDEGDILAITQKGYDKKEDVLKVIDQIKKGAAMAKIDDQSTKK
jgi:uncharacterized protein YegP (UPF0339 family)